MKRQIKVSFLIIALSVFLAGCKNNVSNKVFTRENSFIIFFDNNECSYNGIIFGTYKYDKKTNTVSVKHKNTIGEFVTDYFTYDEKENCIYNKDKKKYSFKITADQVKMTKRR